MAVQIPLKTDPNRDAQRQGHVGYSDEIIYANDLERSSSPYVEPGSLSNGQRVKNIFSTDYSNEPANVISAKMISNRLPTDGDDLNPDFALGSVSYGYQRDEVSSSFRAKDLDGKERKAPNVSPNNEVEYIEPFQTASESKGGFGNEAKEGTLHAESSDNPLRIFPDSIEIISKYQG